MCQTLCSELSVPHPRLPTVLQERWVKQIVASKCSEPGDSCGCAVSRGEGPGVRDGFIKKGQ